MADISVAIVGLGAAGLVALKNLKEQGFSVTGFERNSYIGGLWKYSSDEHTSVLATTVVNISKQRGCFTDFPFSDSVSAYPRATQVYEYLLAYAEHFDLAPQFRLNTPIRQVTFDDASKKWAINIEGQRSQYFDKVIIAIGGLVGNPNMPKIDGLENFTGISIHSQAFKHPRDFASKRVVVIGCGNSAADTATQLVGIADKVHLAHRHGARLLPRIINNHPIDHTLTLRIFRIQSLILHYFPRLGEKLFDKLLISLQNKAFTLRSEWRFDDAQKVPIVSDTLVPYLEDGSIESTHGIKRIISGSSVELDDGTVLAEIDALIWCTGYKSDFSILDPRYNPTVPKPSEQWAKAPGANNKPLFNLYHNVFSLCKPESLAFLGNVHFATSSFMIFEWASMAIAQVWSPRSPSSLPTRHDMQAEVNQHHEWLAGLAQRGHNVSPGNVQPDRWTRTMDELGGTGINEYLGYGWSGWWFWLKEPKVCSLFMSGIWSPHIYRMFETGKRKVWGGSRKALEKVNADVQDYGIKKNA